MIDPDEAKTYGTLGAILLAVFAGVARGRGWLRKRSSADDLAIATDTAEVGILQRALDEAERQRERADTAYAERNQAVQELGGLRAKVDILEQHRIVCERELGELRGELRELRELVNGMARGRQ